MITAKMNLYIVPLSKSRWKEITQSASQGDKNSKLVFDHVSAWKVAVQESGDTPGCGYCGIDLRSGEVAGVAIFCSEEQNIHVNSIVSPLCTACIVMSPEKLTDGVVQGMHDVLGYEVQWVH